MKTNITEVFQELHEAGSFIKSLNSSVLVLNAKIGEAHNIKNSKPISLVRCIYELIAKILVRNGQDHGQTDWRDWVVPKNGIKILW